MNQRIKKKHGEKELYTWRSCLTAGTKRLFEGGQVLEAFTVKWAKPDVLPLGQGGEGEPFGGGDKLNEFNRSIMFCC